MTMKERGPQYKLHKILKNAIIKQETYIHQLDLKFPDFSDDHCFQFKTYNDYLYEHIYTFRTMKDRDVADNCKQWGTFITKHLDYLANPSIWFKNRKVIENLINNYLPTLDDNSVF